MLTTALHKASKIINYIYIDWSFCRLARIQLNHVPLDSLSPLCVRSVVFGQHAFEPFEFRFRVKFFELLHGRALYSPQR